METGKCEKEECKSEESGKNECVVFLKMMQVNEFE